MSNTAAEPSDYQAITKRLEREIARLRRENAELKTALRLLMDAWFDVGVSKAIVGARETLRRAEAQEDE